MLNYALYLQLKDRLLDVAQLSVALKSSAGAYYRAVARLLDELSEFASSNRLDVSSSIAVEQQKLLTFGCASHRPSGKERDGYAAERMQNVVNEIKAFLAKYDGAFSECESVCRQLAVQTSANGVNTADGIMHLLRTNDSLKPYYGQLVGLVGAVNLRTVIDVALTET